MRTTLLAAGLIAVLAAPSFADASCHSRRVTGAVVGTIGGAAIGSGVSRGRLPGTLLGAGLGAFAGSKIAGAGCHDRYRQAYYHRRHHRHHDHDYAARGSNDRYR
ncbi:MAG: glycine zipper 2TM domain-containing protein [Caulobacterales bacterium]